ncbi:methyltransferase domain-containing protein [uncultured Methanobacterium sp.]|uniref:methyltransferase domain-containing protein n=1 Tax=uncultured Methanobacterium sp. TaxID=176306 RepID=UPI003747C395
MNKTGPEKYSKIHEWNQNKLIDRNCPFCNSSGEFSFTRPDNLKIKYCNVCGSFFVSPSPSENELNTFYNTYFSEYRRVELNEYWANRMLSVHPYSDIRVREITSIIDLKGKTVLDVGCGYGQNLINFQKLGATVNGIDLDEESIKFIKNELNIENTKNCDLKSVDGTYDIILLNDFIEHPLNPLDELIKAEQLLNKNGILTIWTPNAHFAFEETNPVIFNVDLEHMQYLSFKTCTYLSEILKLDIIHLESLGFPGFKGFNEIKLSKIDDLKTKVIKVINTHEKLYNFYNSVHGFNSKDIRDGRYHLFCILQKR